MYHNSKKYMARNSNVNIKKVIQKFPNLEGRQIQTHIIDVFL